MAKDTCLTAGLFLARPAISLPTRVPVEGRVIQKVGKPVCR
jgi:hypothetical protein